MEEIKSDIVFRSKDKIEYRVPENLILRKSDDPSNRDITVYDLIAHHAGLKYVEQDIYINELGVEYVRTKFGFESAVRHNLNIRLDESTRVLGDLHYRLKISEEKLNKYAKRVLAYQADRAGQKEKSKKRNILFDEESKSLREQIKLLKTKLNMFRHFDESAINKLSSFKKVPDEKSLQTETIKSGLDWSAFDDLEDVNG